MIRRETDHDAGPGRGNPAATSPLMTREAHGPGRVEPVDAAERDDDPSPAGTRR